MHETGQTSTQLAFFSPMHGSTMTYVIQGTSCAHSVPPATRADCDLGHIRQLGWIALQDEQVGRVPLLARGLGREDTVITCPPEGIVTRNVDQGGEKGVAHLARCAGEPGEGMVGGRARDELAVPDG